MNSRIRKHDTSAQQAIYRRYNPPFLSNYKWLYFLEFLRTYPKARVFFSIVAFVALGVFTLLLVVLIPVAERVIEFISQSAFHELKGGIAALVS